MKKINLSSFVLLSAFIGLSVKADTVDESWHKVLSCDGAHVDNRVVPDRGQYNVQGQVVIDDMGVVRYFNQQGVIQSSLLANNWAQEGNTQPVSVVSPGSMYSFGLSLLAYGPNSYVSFDGNGLLVQLYCTGTEANWYFRNCVRQ